MGKKTKRKKTNSYSKKHNHSKHHMHSKNMHTKHRYRHNHAIHHPQKSRKRLYRKYKEISIIPDSKSVPLFTRLNSKKTELIRIGEELSMGNIIKGLRNYTKNM